MPYAFILKPIPFPDRRTDRQTDRQTDSLDQPSPDLPTAARDHKAGGYHRRTDSIVPYLLV